MIIAVVGAGGKTTWIHKMAETYRQKNLKVFVTTSTHMYKEEDSILQDDADIIIRQLEETGYAIAGIPDGEKIGALSYEVYENVCQYADVVLVEADGSKRKPLKAPKEQEPVIYDNVEEIVVVWGLHGLGRTMEEGVHHWELAADWLDVRANTVINARHAQKLLEKGYLEPLADKYPDKKITIYPIHDGSLYQRAVASLLKEKQESSLLQEEWFQTKPYLFICGGGHVAYELAQHAGLLDFRVIVMDDREEFANVQRFPMAEEVICDSFENLKGYLKPNGFYVVTTRGHGDDSLCVKTILQENIAGYLGMIGSKLKVKKTFERLREEGFDEAQIETVHAPIGLAIGAVTPGEIAISILSQIIQMKNQKNVASASERLLNTREPGMLCIIIEKHGSAPRGTGSMMLVTKDTIIDSIGGGPVEYAVIEDARKHPEFGIRKYHLDTQESQKLGMICGGSNMVLFVPV